MKLLIAAAALMVGVSAKPGTVRINKNKGTFSFCPVVWGCILFVNRFDPLQPS